MQFSCENMHFLFENMQKTHDLWFSGKLRKCKGFLEDFGVFSVAIANPTPCQIIYTTKKNSTNLLP